MAKINKKILIVEDEKPLLNALKDQFESEGFSVVAAADGEEGLNAALQENPDLILLDIFMPKMDGIALMKELKSKGKDIPAIMLTNLDDSDHVSKAIDLGSTDYLVKSEWKLEAIVKRVKEKLNIK